jgi:hypothetical protein
MKYANLIGYSDITPFEVVRIISDKTIEIREMDSKLAEGEQPKFMSGKYAGHCVNQLDLRYDIQSNPDRPVIRARLRKDGKFHSAYGKHVLADSPIRFYDYNF